MPNITKLHVIRFLKKFTGYSPIFHPTAMDPVGARSTNSGLTRSRG